LFSSELSLNTESFSYQLFTHLGNSLLAISVGMACFVPGDFFCVLCVKEHF
jgi:hypothetical protein